MKNRLLFIVFTSFTSLLVGQVYEIGAFLGGSNYVGDIGRTNYIYPNKLAGALFFKFNYNPRIALRATYSYLPIEGNDADANTDFRRNRATRLGLVDDLGSPIGDLKFTNTIHELAVGMEFNFYEYDLSSSDKTWTPYILLELAAFKYTGVTGKNALGTNIFGNKTSLAVPIGIGYKSKLTGNLAFSVEAKFRYTFEDDLDFVSEEISPSLNIEGTSNDWYMFTGVSLIYTFGRPACYASGL